MYDKECLEEAYRRGWIPSEVNDFYSMFLGSAQEETAILYSTKVRGNTRFFSTSQAEVSRYRTAANMFPVSALASAYRMSWISVCKQLFTRPERLPGSLCLFKIPDNGWGALHSATVLFTCGELALKGATCLVFDSGCCWEWLALSANCSEVVMLPVSDDMLFESEVPTLIRFAPGKREPYSKIQVRTERDFFDRVNRLGWRIFE